MLACIGDRAACRARCKEHLQVANACVVLTSKKRKFAIFVAAGVRRDLEVPGKVGAVALFQGIQQKLPRAALAKVVIAKVAIQEKARQFKALCDI